MQQITFIVEESVASKLSASAKRERRSLRQHVAYLIERYVEEQISVTPVAVATESEPQEPTL